MAKVIEWQEYGEDVLFWKWKDNEIKKGSRLVIHPGQDALFLYNGRIEGIFQDDGSYDIASDIVPVLSSLSGFKFGFGSGLRAEVLFINTKEVTVKWGTKHAINIPVASLPGGMPVRSFGTFNCRVDDYQALIEKIAGVQQQFTIDDVKERVVSKLDQLLMKWIAQEGKDLFHLQANADQIAAGICSDLDYEMRLLGIAITDFSISSFTYPEGIQKVAEAQAQQSLLQQAAASMHTAAAASAGTQKPASAGGSQTATFGNGAGQTASYGSAGGPAAQLPNFCPNCGTKTTGTKFCPNCGYKLL